MDYTAITGAVDAATILAAIGTVGAVMIGVKLALVGLNKVRSATK